MTVVDSDSNVAALLARMPLFEALGQRSLARVARTSRVIDAAPATVLFRRGDCSDGLYTIVTGRVKLAVPAADAGEKVLVLLGAGATFGEPALFLGERYLLDAQTLLATKLVHVPSKALRECVRRDASFAEDIIKALSRRVRALIGHIERAALHSGTQRVVDFLIEQLPGTTPNGPVTFVLPAKKRIIASQLDLTHEHFSRILHDLAASRLLVVQGSRVIVPETAKLLAFREQACLPKHARVAA